MKRNFILLICLVWSTALLSQEKMHRHKSDKVRLGALSSAINSESFNIDGKTSEYSVFDADSNLFRDDSDTIYITYEGISVSVINPFVIEGISIVVEGANVLVTSTTEKKDINYCLKGFTSDGMFKIDSEKRFNLLLSGIDITNSDGPAINIQADKKASVMIVEGTTNMLTDGADYADSVIDSEGKEEDQDAAFHSEGKLVFNGNGRLTINGNGKNKHGLFCDDLIEIDGGTINIMSAAKDGIHAKNGLVVTDGRVNVRASGDAIDAGNGCLLVSGGNIKTVNQEDEVAGITSDSTLTISGGTIHVTVGGNQSKGIKSKQSMILSGGAIIVNTSGDVVLEPSGSGHDPSYCTAIKCDSLITIDGANISITTTGKAGKGISSDTDVIITSGTLNIATLGDGSTYTNESGMKDSYNATGITTDGNLSILGGAVIVSSSGSGGKGISTDGNLTVGDSINSPELTVSSSGSRILIGGSDYAEAKAIKSDGAVDIQNGVITISSSDDGIKSEKSVSISKATISITQSFEGIEAPFITVNSGNISIMSSDDCINATHGNGGGLNDWSCLTVYGGYIVVNATIGDGMDSNGDIVITGGTIIGHGPEARPEVGMDYNRNCNVTGGRLVISGPNSRSTKAPNARSTQYSIKAMSNSVLPSSTFFHIQDASGNDIVTFKPVRAYYSIVFSSSDLQSGSTYYLYTGGSSTGTNTDGLFIGGIYSGGTLKNSFIISGKVTNVSF